MLTDNISFFDRLINSSIDMGKHLHMRLMLLGNKIYVKFDDPKAGNSPKERGLPGELKECLTIIARARGFPLKKGGSTVIGGRKQFPSIFGHGIAIRKSQGSTLANMQGDLNQSTDKKTAAVKNYH